MGPKRAWESVWPAFDFTGRLPDNDTSVSYLVSAEVWSGTDPNPAEILGGESVTGLIVWVNLVGGVQGTIYQIIVKATGSPSGEAYSLGTLLAILPEGVL
jgi:hypothetical protein